MSVSMSRKALWILALPIFLCGCSENEDDPFVLVYSDEFDGTALDLDKWEPMLGNGEAYGNPGWGNGEEENYQAENAVVSDGCLSIIAKAEETTIGDETFSVTSARIRSYQKMSVTYGKIEARIKLPGIQGTWPAFWMLPENDYNRSGWPVSGEIDIMENRGSSPTTFSGALHYAGNNGTHEYQTKLKAFSTRNGEEDVTSFHTYGIIWDYDYISWYVDDPDDPFFTIESRSWSKGNLYHDDGAPFDQPFHVLLNMAIGGNFDNGTTVPTDFESATMLVDYVRIYEWR